MLKDIPVNKFFPWSIRNPCTSLSHRRTNFLPSELQCSHRRPKAASPSENPNDSSHFRGLTESTLAPETEPDTAAGALTAVTEYGAEWGRGVTYHYNGSWWGEPPSSAPHVWTAAAAGTCSLLSASAPRPNVAANAQVCLVSQPCQSTRSSTTQSRRTKLPESVAQMCLFFPDFYSGCSFDLRLHTIIKSTKSVLTQMI